MEMDRILGSFNKMTGELLLPSIKLNIQKSLKKDDFIKRYKSYLLYSDKDFFEKYGFFHFSDPVTIWGEDFRLCVLFLSQATSVSSLCTGYSLRVFGYQGSEEDQKIAERFEQFIVAEVGRPKLAPYSMGKIWHLEWGLVFVGETQQDGTEPKISIGWQTNDRRLSALTSVDPPSAQKE
jgi:hypothetical protein